ncbi:MAG TPA: helix-turn-helix transcriptional regulator [Nocardioides sp.]|uniref:helix-turn-helix transcriptional regulator n=1 Tax=Nocardioides sp. TaxID=35761 RepID=UPI002ED7E2BF
MFERRVALRLTQEQLAERTGISRNQIQNIENNRNNRKDPVTGRPGPANARLDTIFLLAEALEMSPLDLIDPGEG